MGFVNSIRAKKNGTQARRFRRLFLSEQFLEESRDAAGFFRSGIRGLFSLRGLRGDFSAAVVLAALYGFSGCVSGPSVCGRPFALRLLPGWPVLALPSRALRSAARTARSAAFLTLSVAGARTLGPAASFAGTFLPVRRLSVAGLLSASTLSPIHATVPVASIARCLRALALAFGGFRGFFGTVLVLVIGHAFLEAELRKIARFLISPVV
jgi:hypothetical protein